MQQQNLALFALLQDLPIPLLSLREQVKKMPKTLKNQLLTVAAVFAVVVEVFVVVGGRVEVLSVFVLAAVLAEV